MWKFKFKTKDGTEFSVFEGTPLDPITSAKANKDCRDAYGINTERKTADGSYNCHGLTFINRLGLIGVIGKEIADKVLLGFTGAPIEDEKTKLFNANSGDEIIREILKKNNYRRIAKSTFIEVGGVKVAKIVSENEEELIHLGDILIYYNYRNDKNKDEITHSAIIYKIIVSGINEMNKALPSEIKDIHVLSKMGPRGGEYIHSFSKANRFYGDKVEIWTDREGAYE
jgi:hypothetical protein